MERPSMNMQKVARCMKTGKSKAACMAEVYPERKSKGTGKKSPAKKSSKTPARKSGGY